jgi:hypothetical protein
VDANIYGTCQQSDLGEFHTFTSGPTCVCGKRAAVFTPGDQERPTLRLIKGEKEDPPSQSA